MGYEGKYLVSDQGRVMNARTARVLRAGPNNCDVSIVSLFRDGKRHSFTVHRLVARHFIPNPHNHPEIDHISRDLRDNSVHNLRWCTREENNRNRGPFANSNCQYKGVCWNKNLEKWTAQISMDKQRKHLGVFASAEDAARAYDAAARDLFGDFALLNFRDEHGDDSGSEQSSGPEALRDRRSSSRPRNGPDARCFGSDTSSSEGASHLDVSEQEQTACGSEDGGNQSDPEGVRRLAQFP